MFRPRRKFEPGPQDFAGVLSRPESKCTYRPKIAGMPVTLLILATLPDVPTFQALGMKFHPRIDRGVAVPKDTPADITAKLEKAFLDTVNEKDCHAKITKAGFVAMGLNSKEAMKYIAEETEAYTKLLVEHDLLLKK